MTRFSTETLQAFRSIYKGRLLLLLLVYIISIPTISRKSLSTSSATSPITHSQLTFGSSFSHHSELQTHQNNRNEEKLTAIEPPTSQGSSQKQVDTISRDRTNLPVGSTTHTSLSVKSIAPKLSSPPIPRSTAFPTLSDSSTYSLLPIKVEQRKEELISREEGRSGGIDCRTDERGRCLEENRRSSITTRSTELADATAEFGSFLIASTISIFHSIHQLKVSPFILFSIIIHFLCLIQLITGHMEDLIIRKKISNPLNEFPVGDSLSKIISRCKWWMIGSFTRYCKELSVLGFLLSFLAISVIECSKCTQGEAIPFSRWLGTAFDVREGGYNQFGMFRIIIFLEITIAFISLIQPIKHLLPSSILPSEVVAPFFLQKDSATEVSTTWFLTWLVEFTSTLISLLEFVVTIFYLSNYKLISLPPHLIFFLVRSKYFRLKQLIKEAVRVVNCLSSLYKEFPGDNLLEEDWICTICFEGDNEEAGETKSKRVRLHCNHRYHAACIVTWLHFQFFCPICHRKIELSSEQSSHPPFAIPPPLDLDLFPGHRGRNFNVPNH